MTVQGFNALNSFDESEPQNVQRNKDDFSMFFRKGETMRGNAYFAVSGSLFAIVAAAHLCRLVFGWSIVVDDIAIPSWVSWLGFLLPGGLALWAFASMHHRD